MSNEPTPAEVERAKRYLATVALHHHVFHDGGVIISGLPSLFHTVFGATKDDAMNTLVHNVAEVFASIGPVIREEVAAMVDDIRPSCDGYETIPNIVATIRAMK